jgi:hypothetical protein
MQMCERMPRRVYQDFPIFCNQVHKIIYEIKVMYNSTYIQTTYMGQLTIYEQQPICLLIYRLLIY